MLFDDGLVYTLAAGYDVDDDIDFAVKIINDTIIDLNDNAINFGLIIAGNYQIFQGLPYGLAKCHNTEIPVTWFGAIAQASTSTIKSNNLRAFTAAILFANLMDPMSPYIQPVITGNNGVYYLGSTLSIAEQRKTITLRDMTISSGVTGTNAIEIYSPIILDRVTINASRISSAYSLLYVNAYNTQYSVPGVNCFINNCLFNTTAGICVAINNVSNVSIKNSKFIGGSNLIVNYTADGKIEFSNNEVRDFLTPFSITLESSDLQFTSNNITDCIVMLKNGGISTNILNIAGNIFKKTNVYVYGNVTNTTITGNAFSGSSPRIGKIQLWADSGRTSVDGLVVTGNSFIVDSVTTSQIISLIGVSSTVSNTIVRDNVCKNIYPVKTHDISFNLTDANITPTSGDDGFDFTIPSSAGWLFSHTGKPLSFGRVRAQNVRTGDTTYDWNNYQEDSGLKPLKVMTAEDGADCPTLPAMRIKCQMGLVTTPYDTRYVAITNLSV